MTYKQRYLQTIDEIHRGILYCRKRLKDEPVLITLGAKQLKAIQVVKKQKGKRPKTFSSEKYNLELPIDYTAWHRAVLVHSRKHFEDLCANGYFRWIKLKKQGIVK